MKLRSMAAILSGFLTVAILTLLTDGILHATRLKNSPNTLYGVELACRSLYTILGGYVTARIAANNGRQHVILLTLVSTIMATLSALNNWDKGTESGPRWFSLALIVIVPATLLSGKLSPISRAFEADPSGPPTPSRSGGRGR